MLAPAGRAEAEAPIELKIVGSLAGSGQFKNFERPFWLQEITELSGGRIVATIHPIDRSGIHSQDMLQLMKLGVVPFGNAPLAIAASDTPFLGGVDLPGLNPDIAAVRRSIEVFRPKLRTVLHDAYNIELLGVFSYPAQMLFCARPFAGLHDIGGFRVRTSTALQSELVSALGAVPVIIAFSDMVDAVRRKTVDCAIAGILGGQVMGLAEITSHVHPMAISWGISIFGANRTAWENLPPDVRDTLREAVGTLEARILRGAEQDTKLGFDCGNGLPTCGLEKARKLTIVSHQESDDRMRERLLRETFVPQWLERCGSPCEGFAHQGPAQASIVDGRAIQFVGSDRGGSGD